MTSRFREGSKVKLAASHPEIDLAAGARGTVWAVYESDPPAYDVTFADSNGTEFDALMNESELLPLGDANAQLVGASSLGTN
jgi:hypothetical protein